jgi:hypothetical protein
VGSASVPVLELAGIDLKLDDGEGPGDGLMGEAVRGSSDTVTVSHLAAAALTFDILDGVVNLELGDEYGDFEALEVDSERGCEVSIEIPRKASLNSGEANSSSSAAWI